MCGPQFCSMKITQEVRDYAAQHGIADEGAARPGLKRQGRGVPRSGGELYVIPPRP